MSKIIIAIDGFSSSGKSTMARKLASTIGYRYVDSGAMYRAVTLYALQKGYIAKDGTIDTESLIKDLPSIKIDFEIDGSRQLTTLNGKVVENEIRGMEVSSHVSPVAAIPEVRHRLVQLQQQFGREKGIVMDGRDIGSTVFPNAELKIFVDASPEKRATRRLKELTEKGIDTTYNAVLANVLERDHLDLTRSESPLKKVDDAVVIDNSDMTLDQQNELLLQLFNKTIQEVQKIMTNPIIEIDDQSGFCFGVVTAIRKAEEELVESGSLYCLGDIVHNSDEVQRLRDKGLKTITHDDLKQLHDVKVLLRAHGEPPSTYQMARNNNIEIIDATCPVVLQLQKRIKGSSQSSDNAQIVIYGKQGHAEVNGLVGQTDGRAIVVQDIADLDKIDFSKDIELYSQTTKSLSGFSNIISEIERRLKPGVKFNSYDTICRQVANRVEHLREFAGAHSVVLFVSGKKSSNGKFLFDECKSVNPATYMISNPSELKAEWLNGKPTIGICGATSTPRWLMEDVFECAKSLTHNG